MRSVTVNIDGDKLRKALAAKKVTGAEASRTCGFNSSYFGSCASVGRLAKRSTVLLEKIYNISPDEYVVKESDGQPEPVKKAIDVLTADELKIVICNAVAQALKEYFA